MFPVELEYMFIYHIFFWESIQVLRRGVRKIVFEMVSKDLFLPTHGFVLRPSRY